MRQAVPRGQFVGQPRVLDEAVLARRLDRPFVQAPGFHIPALDARELCRNQLGAVLEVLGTVFRPCLQQLAVSRESREIF
jgi:hypothetical protein